MATAKIDIGAPLSDAWAEISEVMRWPAWKANCDLAQVVDNAKMGRGAKVSVTYSRAATPTSTPANQRNTITDIADMAEMLTAGDVRMEVILEVVAFEPNRLVGLKAGDTVINYCVSAITGGSRITVEYPSGGFFRKLISPLVGGAYQSQLNKLKELYGAPRSS